jgi:hypothetical protein
MGESVALVQAEVAQLPPDNEYDGRIAIANFELIAGALPEGPVEVLSEPAVVDNFLPPHTYLLLLGDAGHPNTYFVSNGLRGSFVVLDDHAYEQCPTYEGTGETKLATTGITSRTDLIGVLAHAL